MSKQRYSYDIQNINTKEITHTGLCNSDAAMVLKTDPGNISYYARNHSPIHGMYVIPKLLPKNSQKPQKQLQTDDKHINTELFKSQWEEFRRAAELIRNGAKITSTYKYGRAIRYVKE